MCSGSSSLLLAQSPAAVEVPEQTSAQPGQKPCSQPRLGSSRLQQSGSQGLFCHLKLDVGGIAASYFCETNEKVTQKASVMGATESWQIEIWLKSL